MIPRRRMAAVMCRCEETTLGEIRATLRSGLTDMNGVKRMSLTGMRSCQGRYCGPALQEIISCHRKVSSANIAPLNPRPPVRLVPIRALARQGELG